MSENMHERPTRSVHESIQVRLTMERKFLIEIVLPNLLKRRLEEVPSGTPLQTTSFIFRKIKRVVGRIREISRTIGPVRK